MSKRRKTNVIKNVFEQLPIGVIDRIFGFFPPSELIEFFKTNSQFDCSKLFWKTKLDELNSKCYVYEHLNTYPNRRVNIKFIWRGQFS